MGFRPRGCQSPWRLGLGLLGSVSPRHHPRVLHMPTCLHIDIRLPARVAVGANGLSSLDQVATPPCSSVRGCCGRVVPVRLEESGRARGLMPGPNSHHLPWKHYRFIAYLMRMLYKPCPIVGGYRDGAHEPLTQKSVRSWNLRFRKYTSATTPPTRAAESALL